MSKKYSYENKEAIKEIQENHKKEREESDRKTKEEKQEEKNDDDPTYSPGSPRDDDDPTYSPGSPRDDDGKEGSKDEDEPASEVVETDDEEPEDPSAEIIQLEDLDDATVSQHRKGYIKFINEIFYNKLKDLKKNSSLKIYQLLVQNYLALNTPYRGLLVYHGLGTGKTATAISLAEGLSGQMRINTLLPASLEVK